jgi:hypothetical protein
MRLSIAIVFLIGAMVVTEVMCGIKAKQISDVLTLLEKTVTRLESGQSVTDNRKFIYLAIDRTDRLLTGLSFGNTLVKRKEEITPDTPERDFDGILVPRIKVIQRIVSSSIIRGSVPSDDRPVTIFVKFLLGAIADLLSGDLQSAADMIQQSKNPVLNILNSVPPPRSSSKEFGSTLSLPTYILVSKPVGSLNPLPVGHLDPRLVLGDTVGESSGPIPYGFSSFMSDILKIREWLHMMVNIQAGTNPTPEWISNMMWCVTDIAHAIINSVPVRYLPSQQSKFIGRYGVENPREIWNRIIAIFNHITGMRRLRSLPPVLLVVRGVLGGIVHILSKDWASAKTLLARADNGEPYVIDQRVVFDITDHMRTTYSLRPGRWSN